MTVDVSMGPKSRESCDSCLWSPITKSWFGSSFQVLLPPRQLRRLALEEIRLADLDAIDEDVAVVDIDGVAPTPITRLMYGVLVGSWIQPAGGLNTTTSPRE